MKKKLIRKVWGKMKNKKRWKGKVRGKNGKKLKEYKKSIAIIA